MMSLSYMSLSEFACIASSVTVISRLEKNMNARAIHSQVGQILKAINLETPIHFLLRYKIVTPYTSNMHEIHLTYQPCN